MLWLGDVLDPVLLEREITDGFINRILHPTLPLALLNYTVKAQNSVSWTRERTNCRGLVYNTQTLEVVALPFPKFFNFDASKNDLADNVFVVDKMDGSLGILFHYEGEPFIATRGSFTGPQATHATALYREKYHGKWTPPEGETVLVEIIFPDNRIVVEYSSDDLYFLASVVHKTHKVEYLSEARRHWPGPTVQLFGYAALFEVAAMSTRSNAEGYVVQIVKTGLLLKIKQQDYRDKHKLIAGLSAKRVWELVKTGVPTHDILAMYAVRHAFITTTAASLLAEFETISSQTTRAFDELQHREFDDRSFALAVKDHPLKRFLFACRKKQDVSSLIWESLKP